MHADHLTIEPYERSTSSLPQAVRARLGLGGPASGNWRAEAFDDGWVLASDHGEFGGGLQWLPSTGGAPIKLALSTHTDDPARQNVLRIERSGDALYVLQGLSHMGMSDGLFAKVWREQDGFRARVLGHYRASPADWLRLSDGVWLVATENAVWKTTEADTNELVTRLPDGIRPGPSGLARSSDGVLFLGSTEGVLRMTPHWEDAPRYAAELLVPQERRERPCVGYNDGLVE